jgi:hypothetical protein
MTEKSGFLLLLLAWVQGSYYLVTAVWPLVSIHTFQLVTGPKVDLWLVKTVAVMIAGSALALLSSAVRQAVPMEVMVLAVANALGLAAIDIIYVAKGRISRVYLLDAVPEIVLAAAWAIGWSLA